MPRPRLRTRTLMIVVAVCALACAVFPFAWLLFPTFRTHRGRGGKDVPIVVRAIDRETGRPIAGATVSVVHAFRPDLIPPRRAMTGADGRAGSTLVAHASGKAFTAEVQALYHVTLWRTERVSAAGGSVRVDAPGYEAAGVALDEVRDPSAVEVRLGRARADGHVAAARPR